MSICSNWIRPRIQCIFTFAYVQCAKSLCMCVYVYACIYVCLCVYACVYVCVWYVYMYACIYVCVCVCGMYMWMHVFMCGMCSVYVYRHIVHFCFQCTDVCNRSVLMCVIGVMIVMIAAV